MQLRENRNVSLASVEKKRATSVSEAELRERMVRGVNEQLLKELQEKEDEEPEEPEEPEAELLSLKQPDSVTVGVPQWSPTDTILPQENTEFQTDLDRMCTEIFRGVMDEREKRQGCHKSLSAEAAVSPTCLASPKGIRFQKLGPKKARGPTCGYLGVLQLTEEEKEQKELQLAEAQAQNSLSGTFQAQPRAVPRKTQKLLMPAAKRKLSVADPRSPPTPILPDNATSTTSRRFPSRSPSPSLMRLTVSRSKKQVEIFKSHPTPGFFSIAGGKCHLKIRTARENHGFYGRQVRAGVHDGADDLRAVRR